MKCKKCGSEMVKAYSNIVLTSYPPQYPWYWYCGCGHTEDGGIERGKTYEEQLREEWENKNKVVK
jgi:hypothetical protein